VAASANARAFAAMTGRTGAPWKYGKTARSRVRASVRPGPGRTMAATPPDMMRPPRGPESCRWVQPGGSWAAWRGLGGRRGGPGPQAGRDQPGEVRDVGHQQGADAVGDGPEAGEVDGARVGGGTADDQLRAVLGGERGDLVVVDAALRVQAVVDRGEVGARVGDAVAVREVAAVVEAHAEHDVAGGEEGGEDGVVGGGRRVRLHVGVLGAEEGAGPVDRQLLDGVDRLAAGVVAGARVALGGDVHRGGRQA